MVEDIKDTPLNTLVLKRLIKNGTISSAEADKLSAEFGLPADELNPSHIKKLFDELGMELIGDTPLYTFPQGQNKEQTIFFMDC